MTKRFFNHGLHGWSALTLGLMMGLFASVETPVFAAEPTITISAQQRYPWNGLVDVSFKITGDSGTKYDTSFVAKDVVGGTNLAMKTLLDANGRTLALTNELVVGSYKWVWNAATDLPDGFIGERVTIVGNVLAKQILYMEVNLLTGAKTYLYQMPEGGWTKDQKTTSMVFRRIGKGSNSAGGKFTKDMWVGVFEFTQKQAQVLGVTSFVSQYGGSGDMKPVNCDSTSPASTESQTAGSDSVIETGWSYKSCSTSVPYFLTRFRAVSGLSKARLPTATEWQYACRAGTTTTYGNGYSDSSSLAEWATFGGTVLTDVGSHKPNAWGLYDMHGNAAELSCTIWDGTYAQWTYACGGAYGMEATACTSKSKAWASYSYSTARYCACRVFIEID